MRKIIMAIMLIGISYSGYSEVTIIKTKGGLFGRWFRYVEENDGVLSCKDPGFTRCKAMFPTNRFAGNPTQLLDSDFDAIDNYIEGAVTATNTSGVFIYNSEYYITYNYNESNDQLIIHVFSIIEAQNLNLI